MLHRLFAAVLLLVPALALAQNPGATARFGPGVGLRPLSAAGQDGPRTSVAGTDEVGLIVYTDDPDALAAAGLDIQSRYPGFVTARVPARDITRWGLHPAAQFVDLGVEEAPHNDEAAAVTGVRALRQGLLGGRAYDGTGVVVCVIDSGIDWTHLDFRNPADQTQSRILSIWDQTLTAQAGESAPTRFNFSYGVEYTQAHLNDELDGTPTGYVRQRDTNGHGTHVTGTAAGNGNTLFPARNVGMAPRADIVFVKAGNTSFSTSNTIDGITYCGRVAAAQGKPVSINISLGSDFGPHDGTDAKNTAVTAFSALPGRVVSQSAGNSGGTNLHRSGTVGGGATVDLTFTIPPFTTTGTGDGTLFDIWFDEGSNVVAHLITPTGQVVTGPTGAETNVPFGPTPEGQAYIWNYLNAANQDRNITIGVLTNASGPPPPGVYTIRLENRGVDSGTFHAWHYDRTLGSPSVTVGFDGADALSTVGNAALGGLSVGSYVHRWRWAASNGNYLYSNAEDRTDMRSSFSAQGPTRDGRVMPTIAAPGQAMISTRSSASTPSASDLSPEPGYHKSQGTSMASPVVAGAVALLLQQNPALTAAQVIALLQDNATRDAFTGPAAGNEFGAGKLNVYQAMARLVNPASTSTMTVVQYDASVAPSGVTLPAGQSVALRFRSSLAGGTGRVRGVLFHTSVAQPLSGYDVQLWTDAGGLPGAPIGAPVNLAGTGVKPSSWNYVDLSDLGADLSAGAEYHVSITPVGSDGSFRHDGATTTNRTTIDNGSGFSGRAYDAMIRVLVTSDATALPVDVSVGPDGALALSTGWPNPFEDQTHLMLSAGRGGPVRAELFDVLGRRLAVVFAGEMSPGSTETLTVDGRALAPGVYVVRVTTAGAVQTRMLTRR